MKQNRNGLKDIWKGFMVKGAKYNQGPKYQKDSENEDIPYCPTTATELPIELITYEEAINIYNVEIKKKHYDFKHEAFVCFYCDDQKFDNENGLDGIWFNHKKSLNILKHFKGIISPDFSTYLDFPKPCKTFNTYRMRAFGYWMGSMGYQVINNVRWGTKETWNYCFDGIPKNSIVCIGMVASNRKGKVASEIFEEGLNIMIDLLKPHTIIVYGGSKRKCLQRLKDNGINIIEFPSRTNKAHKKQGGL